MISIVIGLSLLLVVASVYILKLSFEIKDLRSDLEHLNIKQHFFVDYIDTLNKQIPAKKAKK